MQLTTIGKNNNEYIVQNNNNVCSIRKIKSSSNILIGEEITENNCKNLVFSTNP